LHFSYACLPAGFSHCLFYCTAAGFCLPWVLPASACLVSFLATMPPWFPCCRLPPPPALVYLTEYSFLCFSWIWRTSPGLPPPAVLLPFCRSLAVHLVSLPNTFCSFSRSGFTCCLPAAPAEQHTLWVSGFWILPFWFSAYPPGAVLHHCLGSMVGALDSTVCHLGLPAWTWITCLPVTARSPAPFCCAYLTSVSPPTKHAHAYMPSFLRYLLLLPDFYRSCRCLFLVLPRRRLPGFSRRSPFYHLPFLRYSSRYCRSPPALHARCRAVPCRRYACSAVLPACRLPGFWNHCLLLRSAAVRAVWSLPAAALCRRRRFLLPASFSGFLHRSILPAHTCACCAGFSFSAACSAVFTGRGYRCHRSFRVYTAVLYLRQTDSCRFCLPLRFSCRSAVLLPLPTAACTGFICRSASWLPFVLPCRSYARYHSSPATAFPRSRAWIFCLQPAAVSTTSARRLDWVTCLRFSCLSVAWFSLRIAVHLYAVSAVSVLKHPFYVGCHIPRVSLYLPACRYFVFCFVLFCSVSAGYLLDTVGCLVFLRFCG